MKKKWLHVAVLQPAIALALTLFFSFPSHAQTEDPPGEIDHGSIELTNPETGEKGAIVFNTVSLGNIEDATPEQLQSIRQDLKENVEELGDGSLTVVQSPQGELPPAALTSGLNVDQVVVPQRAYDLQASIAQAQGIPESPVAEPRGSLPNRVWKGIVRATGETTPLDWVIGTVYYTTPRATAAYVFMSTQHSKSFALFWTLAVAATSIANTVYHRPLDTWARKGSVNPDRSMINKDKLKIWGKYWTWDILIDVWLNFISKKNSLVQMIGDSIPRLSNNAVSVQKSLMFKQDRSLRLTYTLMPLVVMTVIQQINNTMVQTPLWTLSFGQGQAWDLLQAFGLGDHWDLRPTTVAALGAYAVIFGINAAIPSKVVAFTKKLSKFVVPSSDWVARKILNVLRIDMLPTDPCSRAFRARRQADPDMSSTTLDDPGISSL